MSDFFNDQKRQVVIGLDLLKINDYKDIHLATLKILEKTGVFVEDQQARELYGSCGASIDKKNPSSNYLPPWLRTPSGRRRHR